MTVNSHSVNLNADDTAHLTLRLPVSVLDELRAVAEQNERSLSAEARLALKAWLEMRRAA